VKLLALSLLFALSSFAQTAVFPQAVATDAQLGIATNNIQTLLSGSITSTATSFGVVSATGMAANQIATIDSENVWICGVSGLTVSVGRSACPNVDGRGFDGSAAVSHSANGANCSFGTASGCVSEFVVAWNHNAPAKEIEALEKSAFAGSVNAADYMDNTGATDSTVAMRTAAAVAQAAGKCLYIPSLTTAQAYSSTGYAVPTGYYKLSGAITGPAAGNFCLRMDPNTVLLQTAAVDTLDLHGSNNLVSGGIIAYNIAATSAIGINIADASGVGASYNNVISTRVYGNLTTGALGKCFAVTSNYGGGSYANSLLEIYGQFCGTGVYEVGLGVSGPSSNSFVNLGNVTGSIDNSNLAAQFTNAGEKLVSLEMNGNQNGILVDYVVNMDIQDVRGGESAGYRVKFATANAFDNSYRYAGVVGSNFVDLSGGLNRIDTMDYVSTTVDAAGNVHTCIGGCFSTSAFPFDTPNGVAEILDPGVSTNRNLLNIVKHSGVTNTFSWLLFNPYAATVNSPSGGLFWSTASTFSATAPIETVNQGGSGAVYAAKRVLLNGNFLADQYCTTAPGNVIGGYTTACGFGVQARNSAVEVYPTIEQGDGVTQHNLVMPVAADLPACNSGTVAYKVENYPWATSATPGAAPGAGGAFNVMIRCDFDGTNYAWHIH